MFSCTLKNERIIFHVDYNNRDRAKNIGAFWDKNQRCWYKSLDKFKNSPEEIIRELHSNGFSVSDAVIAEISDAISRNQQKMVDLDLIKNDEFAPQPDDMIRELYPFQKAGISFLQPLDSAILADEPGLGKTCQSIGWARYELPCLVVCPASIKINWMREIFANRANDTVAIVNSNFIVIYKKGFQPLKVSQGKIRADWVIINYDIIGPWLAWICEQNFVSMIADEAHYIKNTKTQRGANCLLLSQAIQRKLCVTGTPILNRPTELFPLLQFIGKVTPRDFWWWRKRYCELEEKEVPKREKGSSDWARDGNGKIIKRKTYDVVGTKNSAELHNSIQPYFIRRLKSKVLKDLPDKTYQDLYVEITNREDYDNAERDIVNWISVHEGQYKADAAARAIFLAKLNTLRQLSIRGKMEAVEERLEILKEEGKKAVIFSNYKDVLEKLKVKLGDSAVIYTGKDAEQSAIDKFQNDDKTRWFLTTIKKGGVGLTLTASDTIIFIDLPWTPGEKVQAEDRAHRISQKYKVTVFHIIGENTIDDFMIAILTRKKTIIAKIVDGVGEDYHFNESDTLSEIESFFKNKFKNP